MANSSGSYLIDVIDPVLFTPISSERPLVRARDYTIRSPQRHVYIVMEHAASAGPGIVMKDNGPVLVRGNCVFKNGEGQEFDISTVHPSLSTAVATRETNHSCDRAHIGKVSRPASKQLKQRSTLNFGVRPTGQYGLSKGTRKGEPEKAGLSSGRIGRENRLLGRIPQWLIPHPTPFPNRSRISQLPGNPPCSFPAVPKDVEIANEERGGVSLIHRLLSTPSREEGLNFRSTETGLEMHLGRVGQDHFPVNGQRPSRGFKPTHLVLDPAEIGLLITV